MLSTAGRLGAFGWEAPFTKGTDTRRSRASVREWKLRKRAASVRRQELARPQLALGVSGFAANRAEDYGGFTGPWSLLVKQSIQPIQLLSAGLQVHKFL